MLHNGGSAVFYVIVDRSLDHRIYCLHFTRVEEGLTQYFVLSRLSDISLSVFRLFFGCCLQQNLIQYMALRFLNIIQCTLFVNTSSYIFPCT